MNAHNIIVENSKSVSTEANGIIGINPSKPEYGSIQLATTVFDTSSGFLSKKRTVHFLSGNVEELKELVAAFDIKAGDDYSKKVMPSRIIVRESTTPYYEGQAPKINPSTDEVITSGGKDVYRETALVAAGSSEGDSKLITDKAGAAAGVESPFVEDTEGLSA